MRIDQSYLTLGSIVGTSCRPANTRIFLSPTRSKPAAGAAATGAARTGPRTPPPPPVSAAETEPLAIGAWTLGTGGGGSPYLALLNMRALYRQGARVSLLDPLDLADDDLVAVVSNMGAPPVGPERPTDPPP